MNRENDLIFEAYKDSLSGGMDQISDNFKWAPSPKDPNGIIEGTGNYPTLTKGEFWKNELNGRPVEDTIPALGKEHPDGTWEFEWDDLEGTYKGFIKGVDFIM